MIKLRLVLGYSLVETQPVSDYNTSSAGMDRWWYIITTDEAGLLGVEITADGVHISLV